jgi:plastocyanin
MVRMRWLAVLVLAVVVGTVATACGGGGTTVEVTLQEFAVVPSEASVGAGDVTFEATNNGPDDPHELVVIKTDLVLTELPTDENGAVDEAGAGIEVIGEIEEFAVGETQSDTFNLAAGNYVLICNIWEEAEQESHYQNGMRTSFTVEA